MIHQFLSLEMCQWINVFSSSSSVISIEKILFLWVYERCAWRNLRTRVKRENGYANVKWQWGWKTSFCSKLSSTRSGARFVYSFEDNNESKNVVYILFSYVYQWFFVDRSSNKILSKKKCCESSCSGRNSYGFIFFSFKRLFYNSNLIISMIFVTVVGWFLSNLILMKCLNKEKTTSKLRGWAMTLLTNRKKKVKIKENIK